MLLNWLKRIFGIPPIPPTLESDGGEQAVLTLPQYDRLDGRKKIAKEEKDRIKSSSTEWYRLDVPKRRIRSSINIYHSYEFSEILNLKTLKEERLKRDIRERKILEDEVKVLLNSVEETIKQRKAEDVKVILDKVIDKIVKTKDSSIRQKYQQLQNSYAQLIVELEREKLAWLAEEKRRKEKEEQKRKEAEEKARKEKKKREQKEYERREAEAQRLANEIRKKAQTERLEKQRLMALSSELKDDWKNFKQVLDDNRVRYLYHFTDKRNIPSIKRHGGLLSWHYCHTHGISIPCQGGDSDSRELDKKYGLEDYVRLSFCDDHPMAYRLRQSGSDIVVLRISVDVALLKDTQFSNMNAADKRHTHGKTLDHLQMVDFDAVKMHYVRNDDPNFKLHQAEVMVKTFVPIKFIENL